MSQSIFRQIKRERLKRSGFNLSFNNKLTAEMGLLYPILIQDVVPGDTFKLNTQIFMRMAPMTAPMMSRVKVYTHYFFVPKRLLWSHWKDFITGQPQDEARINAIDSGGGEYTPPEYPYFQLSKSLLQKYPSLFHSRSLCDYLGFPVFDKNDKDGRFGRTESDIIVDALPIRAYNLIWNEYYRDQNIQKPVYLSLDSDGKQAIPEDSLIYLFDKKRRAWKKDYFTSALPFAQAGPDVELPISGVGSVRGSGFENLILDPSIDSRNPQIGAIYHKSMGNDQVQFSNGLDTSIFGIPDTPVVSSVGNNIRDDEPIYQDLPFSYVDDDGNVTYAHGIDLRSLSKRLNVDLSTVSASTINEVRRAFAAQRFLEAEARGGSRYIEELYSIFGVKSSDATLQRPQYLGGGSQDIVVSDVLQTSATEQSTSPQGNQAGVGASMGGTHSFKRNFEEHGYIIGLMSIIPNASYQQGMPKMFTKFDRLDHYWPQFAHLGEQEIKESELYYTGQDILEDGEGRIQNKLFGYTPRYAEYKFNFDTIHGDFRDTLDFWHLGRKFDKAPGLNQEFISAEPSKRVFAYTESEYDHFWFNIQHSIKAIRSMPFFGTPH
ncbi:major capsid protein [Dipodfec virus UOA04_Rod_1058]|nr:major capsid protein [Dipodfec virus UOA04_Rod_1058]